jgi:iron-sulfur cluster repair protein YtfE (RIC family)
MTTPTDNEALREELWAIMGRRNQKILAAQKSDAVVLPYFKADDEAATEIIDLFTRHTQAAEVAARIDELHRMFGHPKKGEIGYEAVKARLAELKAALPGSEGEG